MGCARSKAMPFPGGVVAAGSRGGYPRAGLPCQVDGLDGGEYISMRLLLWGCCLYNVTNVVCCARLLRRCRLLYEWCYENISCPL